MEKGQVKAFAICRQLNAHARRLGGSSVPTACQKIPQSLIMERLWRDCADAQARLSLHCLHVWKLNE